MSTDLNLSPGTLSARGQCSGGRHPEYPLDGYPLLCWAPDHARHGDEVFTEDGAASVAGVVAAFRKAHHAGEAARQLGTLIEHVEQALAYGLAAGYLEAGP